MSEHNLYGEQWEQEPCTASLEVELYTRTLGNAFLKLNVSSIEATLGGLKHPKDGKSVQKAGHPVTEGGRPRRIEGLDQRP
jgi:hypothetical protein